MFMNDQAKKEKLMSTTGRIERDKYKCGKSEEISKMQAELFCFHFYCFLYVGRLFFKLLPFELLFQAHDGWSNIPLRDQMNGRQPWVWGDLQSVFFKLGPARVIFNCDFVYVATFLL